MNVHLLKVLNDMKRRILRKKLWNLISNREQMLINLVLANITIVRNKILAITISRLIVKLLVLLKYSNKRLEEIGRSALIKFVTSAIRIGWSNASKWIYDILIVRWLGLFAYTRVIG